MINRNYSASFASGTFQSTWDVATAYSSTDVVTYPSVGNDFAYITKASSTGEQPDLFPDVWTATGWKLNNGTTTGSAKIASNVLTIAFQNNLVAAFDSVTGFDAPWATFDVSSYVNPLAFRARAKLSSCAEGTVGSAILGITDDRDLGGSNFLRGIKVIADGGGNSLKYQLVLLSTEAETVVDSTTAVALLDGDDWLEISFVYGRITARYGRTEAGAMPTTWTALAPGNLDNSGKHNLTPYVVLSGTQTFNNKTSASIKFDDFYVESIFE